MRHKKQQFGCCARSLQKENDPSGAQKGSTSLLLCCLGWGEEEGSSSWGRRSVLGVWRAPAVPSQPLPEGVTPPGGHKMPQQRDQCERQTHRHSRALLPWIAAGCPWAGWGWGGERCKLCSSDSVLISSSSVPGLHLHSLILKSLQLFFVGFFFLPLLTFYFILYKVNVEQ